MDSSGLYAMSNEITSQGIELINTTTTVNQLTLQELHIRSGHLSKRKLVESIKDGTIDGIKVKE